MLQYEIYKSGVTQHKLVLFLHGYNDTITNHQNTLNLLKQNLSETLLIMPHAPEISDKNPQKRQWFGMRQYDADNIRTDQTTSVEEIIRIYNRTAADIDYNAELLNNFITGIQEQYGISDANTYLIGFSQGAMLALYASLTRNNKLGGVFVLSGLIAGAQQLQTKIKSKPLLYLFHGTVDTKVQFKTFAYTLDWLKKNQVEYQYKIYENLAHKISEDEISYIAAKINQTN